MNRSTLWDDLTDAELLTAVREQSVTIVGDRCGRDATYREKFHALTVEAKRRNLIGWEA